MEIKYHGEELTVGGRYFYCNSVDRHKIDEFLALWKNKVIEAQDGESAYIAVEWDDRGYNEIAHIPILKCFKAIKQGEKVSLYAVEAYDWDYDAWPESSFYGTWDKDCWLRTFSDLEASQMPLRWISESYLAQYNLQEFIDLAIYSGSHQSTNTA